LEKSALFTTTPAPVLYNFGHTKQGMKTAQTPDYQALYEESKFTITELKFQVEQLRKMLFGARHEKFIPSSNLQQQLFMQLEAETVESTNIAETIEVSYKKDKSKKHPGRIAFPEHLRREELIIEPEGITEDHIAMGDERTEQLCYKPGEFYVKVIIRKKYRRQTPEGKQEFFIAPLPPQPIHKSIAGASLLAQINIDKFIDHLPLYRQQQRFKRSGLNIPYSTIADLTKNSCLAVEPLYDALKEEILATCYIGADETPIQVMDNNVKRKTAKGYFWLYQNYPGKMVFFDYQPGRGREGPRGILKHFEGYLQTDGYSAYDDFDKDGKITLIGCLVHARRYFFDALGSDKERAEYVLGQMKLIFDIEQRCKSLGDEERKDMRQELAVPILQQLGEWMKQEYGRVMPRSKIGEALAYSIKRWTKLMAYTDNGMLECSNNLVENSVRPVAVGRKNYLFAGSHESAYRMAIMYSLLGTCKLNDVNPLTWLTDVLEKMPTWPKDRIKELLPMNWKP